ncbi:SusC/RagA family TonB-linked outer membrane protein [Sphingobacterium sp. SG20118]|uniref:SusC/RagA family TonB-linked outer membrane protein n=1 Tax=Sphingobacterium sp. SG20118 TaxID=3367156 RepID=UPI0037DFC64A
MINFYKDGRVHAYFKGILQSIYNLKNRCRKLGIARRYPTAEYALENNIAHATTACFGSQVFTDDISSILGDSCVPESGLGRHSFGGSSPKHQTISREIASKYQARSKGEATNKHRNGNQTAEEKQRKTRAEAEDFAEISRGEAMDLVEISRAEATEVVLSDELLTNFVPTSNILRVGFESASNFLRVKQDENSKPTRIKLDKKPKNGRIWSEERGYKVGRRTGVSADRLFSNSGQLRTMFVPASKYLRPAKYPLITFQLPFLGQPMCGGCVGGVQEMGEVRRRLEGSTNPVPRMYCLGTVSSRGSYRKGTGSVLRSYWRGTKELLRSYWKGTAFCKFCVSSGREASSSSLEGSLSQISAFKPLKFLSQVFTRVECDNPLNRLKCFSNLAQGVGKGIENKGVVRLFGSARFSIMPILLLLMTFGALISQAQSKQGYVLQGTVVSAEDKKPLQGVSVRVEAENIKFSTKKDGTFSITVSHRKGMVKFTNVGYKTVEQEYTSGVVLSVQLTASDNQLEEVDVVSTGYQKIPKERATGSFVTIDRELLDRRVSTNIIDRLEGVTSGLVFNKSVQPGENESLLSIRGRSTLFGNTKPLIVLDNFPYEGDIDNIDPNSIAHITVLKDAAASSIWGARAGNGVIVLTTKQGYANRPPTVDFSTSVNIGAKPDLYYYPRMSNKDYIDVERELFNRGFFNGRINSNPRRPLSDAVELLLKERNGELSATETQAALEGLASQDVRKDLNRYFYRTSVNQRHGVDISGGAKRIRYYFGVGYDHNQDNRIRNGMERVTVTNRNHYTLIENKLELSSTIAMSTRKTDRSSNVESSLSAWPYLYARLADDAGNALPIPITHSFSYTDTAGQGLLDDWLFRPLDELTLRSNTTNLVDYRIGSTLKYSPMKGLSTTLLYQYYSGNERKEMLNDGNSYFVRDMVNQFTQLDLAGGRVLKRAAPQGAILDRELDRYVSQKVRALIEYNLRKDRSDLAVLVGAEVSEFATETDGSRLYGYDERNATSLAVDLVNTYPTLPTGGAQNIQNLAEHRFASDRYVSYFGNFSYTYDGRYTLSGSARKDASNLFGVHTNQRSVPLWSTGLLWDIGKETFYGIEALPILKLRATYGYNGNADKSVSAYTTARAGFGANRYGVNYFTIQNPPNADLRWEQIGMLNIGLEFGFRNQRLSGSVEYFLKDGKDLMGSRPLPSSVGITQFKGNNANLSTQGLDVQLSSINTTGVFRWNTNALLSLANDRVTKYLGRPITPATYVQNNFPYPYEGKPYNSIFVLRWAGLDPQTGAPRGYKDGEISTDYTSLVGVTDDSEIIYTGRGRAGVFGALRNTFAYRGVELSFNVTYKLGFNFKAPSVSYRTLLTATGGNTLQPGYEQRWQQPGDEERTHVPAFYYPVNNNREVFYSHAEVHVQRGDHIRLQDVQASYRIKSKGISWLREMKVFAYANNLGLLWKASDTVLDPDYIWGTPPPFSLALGLNIGFN